MTAIVNWMIQVDHKERKIESYVCHKGEKDNYHHPELTDNQIEGFMRYWSTNETSYVMLFLQMMSKKDKS